MKPGDPETRTHDHKRTGTACLMAALDVSTGKAAGRTVEQEGLGSRRGVEEGAPEAAKDGIVKSNQTTWLFRLTHLQIPPLSQPFCESAEALGSALFQHK